MPGLAERVAARRALRAARRFLVPPTHIPAPPVWARQRQSAKVTGEANGLEGAAVSSGRATAEACVILSPDEFGNMHPGTILVCPTTTPAWTQLFPLARGLVTDIGGILAHGSIVCREYRIPGGWRLGTRLRGLQMGRALPWMGIAAPSLLAKFQRWALDHPRHTHLQPCPLRRVRSSHASSCYSSFYEPLRFIEEICMLDHLPRGRLGIGVGKGISPAEHAL